MIGVGPLEIQVVIGKNQGVKNEEITPVKNKVIRSLGNE